MRPRGDIDLATVGELDEHIAGTLGADETTGVVIDMSEVSFIDSTGIASLLRGRRLADEPPKPYRIVGASGLVREVLELTGVWAHLSAPPV
jgi:anti-sigma B factor antagonist